MSVPDIRTNLLEAQLKITPDVQVPIRDASSELLQAQTAVDRDLRISEEVRQTLDNASIILETTRQNIGWKIGPVEGILKKLNDAFDALPPVKLLRKASPNGQVISDARIHIQEAKAQLEYADDDIKKAKQKLNAVKVGDSPKGNIREAEILLQEVQARVGEVKSYLQTALKLIQTIPTGGQITLGFLLGIALAAFGWYELSFGGHGFDGVQFVILGIALLASCGSAVYLAEAIPRVAQRSTQKYVVWFCCIVLLILIGFALFYGILHQLTYTNTQFLSLPDFMIFTSLIVIAPLATFIISCGDKYALKTIADINKIVGLDRER